jgi:hypothetical protein
MEPYNSYPRIRGRCALRAWSWFAGALLCLLSMITVRAQAPAETPITFALIGGYDYNADEPYEPAPLRVPNGIPANIKALNGKKVKIYGNAMPLNFTSGVMSEFILNATVDLCAFGATPRINEWIFVTMSGDKRVPVTLAGDMLVRGTFQVQEEIEDGRVVGLYRIVADAVQ